MKYYLLLLLALITLQCNTTPNMQQTPVTIHAIRLKPGQDLQQEIDSLVAREHITAGWIMTCVGSLTQTNLRYANQPNGSSLQGHFEIVSLTGTVSINGSHLHMSISDSTGTTIGGHLLPGNIIYTTAEIVIGQSHQHIFTREKDGTTPWEELQIQKQ